jgi:hypothetical protein
MTIEYWNWGASYRKGCVLYTLHTNGHKGYDD